MLGGVASLFGSTRLDRSNVAGPENREPENPNSPLMPYEVAQVWHVDAVDMSAWNVRWVVFGVENQ